jgi:dinuclear metal center YbgI/SA1388 family protein
MRLREITDYLESIAPLELQESYDNSGLLVGSPEKEVTAALVCLDSTPVVIEEARQQGCNLIIAHHPIIFGGLSKLTGTTYVERTVIEAIRHDIAIYAIHTNLDNVLQKGVNGRIADILELSERSVLHPLQDASEGRGAGVIGMLPQPMPGRDFLAYLQERMQTDVIRHTAVLKELVSKVAVCGGSGSFLLEQAVAGGAQAFVTADFKYHQFFDADGRLMICDIGHYESEQFTVDLILDLLREKFPNFAARSSETVTNPITYFK